MEYFRMLQQNTEREPLFFDFLDVHMFKKKIEKTDAEKNQGRLLVHKTSVEDHVFPFWDEERVGNIKNGVAVDVTVYDTDTHSEHQMKFKKQPSNGCYVFIGNWNKDFLERRGLVKDDEIGLNWDQANSRFNFRVLNKAGL